MTSRDGTHDGTHRRQHFCFSTWVLESGFAPFVSTRLEMHQID